MLTSFRKPLRLPAYDYRLGGIYFVTIVTHRRQELFGTIVDARLDPTAIGDVVTRCWADIPTHFPHVTIDTSVVMPNHVHGVLAFSAEPPQLGPATSKARALGTVIGAFKAAVTRQVRQAFPRLLGPVWQRNFYEHVVRDECALERIRLYVAGNPQTWDVDAENTSRTGRDSFEAWLAAQGATEVPKPSA